MNVQNLASTNISRPGTSSQYALFRDPSSGRQFYKLNDGSVIATEENDRIDGLSALTVGTTGILNGGTGRVLFQGTGNVLQESDKIIFNPSNGSLSVTTPNTDTTSIINVSGPSLTLFKVRADGKVSVGAGVLQTVLGTDAALSISNGDTGSGIMYSSTVGGLTLHQYDTIGATQISRYRVNVGGSIQTLDAVRINNTDMSDGSYSAGMTTQSSMALALGTDGEVRMTIAPSSWDIYIGQGIVSSTPHASSISAQGGLGTNIAGSNLNLRAGAGTGNSALGYIGLWTSNIGGSGSTLQSYTEKARITKLGDVVSISESNGFVVKDQLDGNYYRIISSNGVLSTVNLGTSIPG